MALQLFNTLSGKTEEFDPLEDNLVRMYACGPTVYDYGHIGNFRTFVAVDVLRRFLKQSGYKLKHVMNITDVEDKIIRNAAQQGLTVQEYTQKYIKAFLEDADALNIEHPEMLVKATDHIHEMAHFIAELHDKGYAYATDLVGGLKAVGDFEISVAAYPEGHPEAHSKDADLDNLKRKIDAGATRAITQYFFDVELYARFLERARKAGITVPIVPGLLPVTNFAQVIKFSAACGTSVPRWLADMFDGLDQDPETRRLVACTVAAEQANALRALGCDDFHFYTLNRADLTVAICRRLGLKPQASAAPPPVAAA